MTPPRVSVHVKKQVLHSTEGSNCFLRWKEALSSIHKRKQLLPSGKQLLPSMEGSHCFLPRKEARASFHGSTEGSTCLLASFHVPRQEAISSIHRKQKGGAIASLHGRKQLLPFHGRKQLRLQLLPSTAGTKCFLLPSFQGRKQVLPSTELPWKEATASFHGRVCVPRSKHRWPE